MEIADLAVFGAAIAVAALIGVGFNRQFKRRKDAKNAKNKDKPTGIESL